MLPEHVKMSHQWPGHSGRRGNNTGYKDPTIKQCRI